MSEAAVATTGKMEIADLTEVLGRSIAERGIALEQGEAVLRPGLRESLPDPLHLRDMDRAATAELIGQLARLAPFGVGNAEPRFALPSVRILRPKTVGEGHLRCILTGAGGGGLKAIAFRAFDSALGETLARAGSLPFHVAGKLRPDAWTGPDAVQLIIDDAAPASG